MLFYIQEHVLNPWGVQQKLLCKAEPNKLKAWFLSSPSLYSENQEEEVFFVRIYRKSCSFCQNGVPMIWMNVLMGVESLCGSEGLVRGEKKSKFKDIGEGKFSGLEA